MTKKSRLSRNFKESRRRWNGGTFRKYEWTLEGRTKGSIKQYFSVVPDGCFRTRYQRGMYESTLKRPLCNLSGTAIIIFEL